MIKPSEEALEKALAAAQRMRANDVDPHHLAQAVLYLHERNQRLEEVLKYTERFIRFGMAEPELAQLRRLVQRLREEGGRQDGGDADNSMLL